MEKHAVWNSKIECNPKITAANDCSVTDTNCNKHVSDEAPVYQQPEHCAAESSYSPGMLEGMVVHYLQSDHPSNLRLKAQSVNNSNLLSCKRDLSERTPDSKVSIKQAENYRQEYRENQIQQWVSKHSHTQEALPKDHWLGFYPQPRGGGNASETSASLQLLGAYQDLGTSQCARQPQAFVKNSSSTDHVESSKKHVHFLSSNALIADSSSLQASEGSSLKRRKLTDSKVDADQEFPYNAVTTESQPNEMTGLPSLGDEINETEVTLRQWLSRPGRAVDCLESLNIFKQILQFVDLAHMQGVVLKNIRPSLFILSSLHRVTFLDSASSSSSSGSSEPSTGAASGQASLLADTATMRVGSASQNTERQGMAQPYNSRDMEERMQPSSWRMMTAVEHTPLLPAQTKTYAEGLFFGSGSEAWETGNAQMQDNLRNAGDCHSSGKLQQQDIFPVRSTRLMEDMWYTSPEEVQDGTCSFSSDIYSLGVLFFELFCPFSSWEEHSKIMLDLRHRILPSSLLSDRPKEAAFCLWLLHPEPNSRPKSRDVLQSEILNDAGEALAERQDAMNLEERELEAELLQDFLLRMQEQKSSLACKLKEEISCLTSDIMEVKRRRSCAQRSCTTLDDPDPSSRITQEGTSGLVQWSSKQLVSSGGQLREDTEFFSQGVGNEVAVDSIEKQSCWGSDTKRKEEQIRSKSARLMSNFDKFEEAYFAMRWNVQSGALTSQATQEASSGSAPAGSVKAFLDVNKSSTVGTGNNEKDSLGCFFDSLCKYARYSRFEVKATLLHGNLSNTSNMVCSLSFDRDQEYFATAGICRRIRVFDCDAVLSENVDIHYPVVEMMANSKLSSICWNSYIKSHIASSDYDGVVQLWDASTAQTLMQYKEHKKRAWSVDFSQADPTKLASGSDDGSVKLWSINQEGSIGTIKTEANVCCVQFPGDSAHRIAFGSADYKVYCYDLRNIRVPWCVLVNHSKAVSYVKFLDSDTVVSASTDSTLKLWQLSRTNVIGGVCKMPSLTYTGHANEKNFVGLSVMDGYIACGSENNAVFAYHKSLPMPVATHKFGWVDPLTGKSMGDDTGKFVSSVCWRAKSQTLVAANSLGNVKVLEMV